MTTQNDYSPERLADRAQIHDVICRWCRAVDRLDYDAIRTLFHPEAIDEHGMYNGGIDGLIEWIRGRHKTIPFSMHSISNMLIEFGGPDTAIVETYVFAVQRYPADGKASLAQLAGGVEGKAGVAMDLMGCARYVDRFERRDSQWRIQHRTVVYDSTMLYEVSDNAPRMGDGWIVGKRNATDHVYQARSVPGVAT